ncbi:hypothetical protein SH203_02863 [Brevundimonas sp. SH203]|uniref:hypothetical protein n=1 Tax=Brevundimonas sp. SH203 TaxID=345167 RepID=UPI0009D24B61|nr:hypothetical protein [Brevundimonas sp. SH203]GAW42447.1 hypothetical protein SH203_02863 [Brevundimonas sp. SH203]
MPGGFNFEGIQAPPLPPARIDLTEADMDDWRDAVVHGTGPLGCYVPKFDEDGPYDGVQVEGVWIDEMDLLPLECAGKGKNAIPAVVMAALRHKATPCIPDSAPSPVIDWMHRPPPPLAIRLVRAVAVLAVMALAAWVILS